MEASDLRNFSSRSPGDFKSDGWDVFSNNFPVSVREHLYDALCPHFISIEGTSEDLDFFHAYTKLRDISFNITDYGINSGKIDVQIPPTENMFFLQYILKGTAQFQHQGATFDISDGHMAVLSPQEAGRQISFPGCRHLVVKIPKGRLDGILSEDLGFRTSSLMFSSAAMPLAGGAAGSLATMISAIFHDLRSPSSTFAHARVVGGIEETLCRLLLASVPHNYSDAYTVDRPRGIVPYYIRRAEMFIHEHFEETVSLADIVAASMVSGRSLHAGFRRYRGESPMNYLRRYRLERAHLLLQKATGSDISVTDVAFAVGFLHPSKFSQDYRARFGVSPSETLRNGKTKIQ